MCFWTVFTLSGIYGYRKANQVLLKDGDVEEKWGFGQVIAVVSLLLVGFEFWKAFVSKYIVKVGVRFKSVWIYGFLTGVEYREPLIEDLNGCHCPCSCGKRIDSFST